MTDEKKTKYPKHYKFLNMDSQEFLSSGELLAEEFRGVKHLVRMIPSLPEFNQILCAAGTQEFTAREAVQTCRKLTGVI